MGTKVIDKLRIQGKSAPRVALDSTTPSRRSMGAALGQVTGVSPALYGSPLLHAEPVASRGGSRGHASRPTLVLIPEPGQEVKSKIRGRPLGSSIPTSSSSSAASRRLEFLHRVQQANRGLSTADADMQQRSSSPSAYSRQQISDSISSVAKVNCAYTNQLNATLPNIQFLLRGKPVTQELEVGPYKVSSAPSMKSDFTSNNNQVNSYSVQTYVSHQRVGHYKTSAKEVYRARHKNDIVQNLLMDSRHASSAYHAIRTGDIDVSSNANTVLGNNIAAANGPAYFYLGPPMSAPNQTKSPGGTSTLNRPKLYIPTASEQISNGDAALDEGRAQHRGLRHRSSENFSLTGQQFTTPRLVNMKSNDEGDLHDYHGHVDGLGDYQYLDTSGRPLPFLMPDIYNRPGGSPPPISGSRSRKHGGTLSTRCMSRESSGAPPVPPSSSAAGVDLELLQQCLHVNQPHAESGAGVGASDKDAVRLKHLTQYAKKDDGNSSVCNSSITNKTGKVNYNNPYHNHRSSERKAAFSSSKQNRYVFNSVNSYIHFNKIYPKLDGNAKDTANITTGTISNGVARHLIPQVDGFSPHCTETVMLKMMFGMNKPVASVKSGAPYSDIAVHADLDEFVVVGSTTTTSASRSTSVASRKLYHNSTNNVVADNGNDSGIGNNKRLSNGTIRRSKSNLSSSMDISVDLRERKGEESQEENNVDEDPTWPIPEVEDDLTKTPEAAANVDLYIDDDDADYQNGDNDADANVTGIALDENDRTVMEEEDKIEL
ncbi:hypothetical protein ElyMa_003179700 [Elysia marginata]|uniref:Uncharacterized protein n=1 Tax=Elysia marginata TaxID=1093978 RepID=A0AAV4IX49_9GAST|nr:hypothetical protein ElyMa_003179700 [Elysia marginata]